jgi:hypothetical protein
MTRKKIIIALILCIIGIGVILLTWYKYNFSMDEAKAFEINNSNYPTKLLIATQGSQFKDALTNQVIDYFKEDSIYIQVIDISQLSKIKSSTYNATLLIHTWEGWGPPVEITDFIQHQTTNLNKTVVFTTSGNGTNKMDNVDAITGESKIDDIRLFSNKIIVRLKPLLQSHVN